MTPLLQVEGLARQYRLPRQRLLGPPEQVQALQGVSFTLEAGRSLGVVGESGSGKSTLARLVVALEAPSAGTVRFEGRDLHALRAGELRRARAGFQMVFQDPFGSLDPRQPVARIVAEPLEAQRIGTPAAVRVGAMLLPVTATQTSPSCMRFDSSLLQVKMLCSDGCKARVAAKPGSMLRSPPPLVRASITNAAVPQVLCGAVIAKRPRRSGRRRSAHEAGGAILRCWNSSSR